MNPVCATGHFLYPLKTLENLSIPPWKRQKTFGFLMLSWGTEGFSDVFMRDRKGPVAWNGLTFFHLAHFSLTCVGTYSKLTLPFLKINKRQPQERIKLTQTIRQISSKNNSCFFSIYHQSQTLHFQKTGIFPVISNETKSIKFAYTEQ